MQVVAEADEREAFFQELAHAGGSEQEQAQDDVIALCGGAQLVCGCGQLGRCVHIRELVFFVQAHGHAKIVLAQEQNIHARNRGDLVNVFDAVGGLHLKRHDRVVVGGSSVTEQSSPVHTSL